LWKLDRLNASVFLECGGSAAAFAPYTPSPIRNPTFLSRAGGFVEARPTKRLSLFGVRRLRRRFRVLHPVAHPHLPARHAAHHRPGLAVIQRSAATKDLSPPLPFSVPPGFLRVNVPAFEFSLLELRRSAACTFRESRKLEPESGGTGPSLRSKKISAPHTTPFFSSSRE
jgi:hypothetical protein